ncbi:MAG: CDP-glycerol glycerophosphotransferase family protein [Oscillospiraceae bacterium]|nr:CDP-glycerol glycerophosphotransferase family protein [Oscillospiraceae bacterium]
MRFYIDPGTGSMLFTILIGVLGAGIYALRDSFMKLRFYLTGGKAAKDSGDTLPFAIFTDSKRYWNVFEPICDEFEKRGQALVYMTASPDDPALNKSYEHVKCQFIGEGNKAFAKLNMLKADVLLSSTPGLEVYQWKRSRDVKFYAHIAHAASDITVYRMFGIDYYDAILLSGDYQVEQVRRLEALRNLPAKEVPIVGLPYMDVMKARLDQAEPLGDKPRTVLLAPSWGESAIFNRYGGKIIDALLATGYHVVVRPHPQSFTSEKDLIDDLMARYPDSDQLEWNRDNDNFQVLRRSDILISDFSGVIFDFSLVFDKPVIYADTTFDKSPYDAYWLDEELWTFQTLPKIGMQLTAENLDQIRTVIDTCIEDPRFQQNRDAARRETWQYMGEGAVRTVDYLMEKYRQLQEAKNADTAREQA